MHCGDQALKKIGGALFWLMLESLPLGCNSLFWLVGIMWGVLCFKDQSINMASLLFRFDIFSHEGGRVFTCEYWRRGSILVLFFGKMHSLLFFIYFVPVLL
jgi:hypothetical protein